RIPCEPVKLVANAASGHEKGTAPIRGGVGCQREHRALVVRPSQNELCGLDGVDKHYQQECAGSYLPVDDSLDCSCPWLQERKWRAASLGIVHRMHRGQNA